MSDFSTPLMRQYNGIKERYPNALLLFRLGDFYELFFEDAIVAAKELQITLTSRNKEKGVAVPICGVPYHAAGGEISQQICRGYPVSLTVQGEAVLTPDIWHPKGPIYRAAIFPGRSESFDYAFKVPARAAGPLTITARLRYRKANQFFMDAVYENEHRQAPITDISSATAQIALLGMP